VLNKPQKNAVSRPISFATFPQANNNTRFLNKKGKRRARDGFVFLAHQTLICFFAFYFFASTAVSSAALVLSLRELDRAFDFFSLSS